MRKLCEIANIVKEDGSTMQRVGEVWQGRSGGVLFSRVGEIKRFDQIAKSKSLRMARVRLKQLIGEAM